MGMLQKDLGDIKYFIKDKSPDKLVDMMLENNIRRKCYHNYSIVFASGFWYAWFEVDINDLLRDRMNDANKSK